LLWDARKIRTIQERGRAGKEPVYRSRGLPRLRRGEGEGVPRDPRPAEKDIARINQVNRQYRTRRPMLKIVHSIVLAAGSLALRDGLAGAAETRRPNIVLVMPDDVGYGDFACTGNPIIRTPHVDAFAKQSVRFTDFHVSPTCAPTRSSLMTGR